MRKSFLVALLLVVACGVMIAAPSPDAKYISAEKCKMCHSDKFAPWSKTAHSQAFDLLVSVGQDKNAECLKCHSTGYGKGGYTDETTTPNLKAVQCEACHGPGSEHNGDPAKIVRVPPATVCGGCHQDQNIHPVGR